MHKYLIKREIPDAVAMSPEDAEEDADASRSLR